MRAIKKCRGGPFVRMPWRDGPHTSNGSERAPRMSIIATGKPHGKTALQASPSQVIAEVITPERPALLRTRGMSSYVFSVRFASKRI